MMRLFLGAGPSTAWVLVGAFALPCHAAPSAPVVDRATMAGPQVVLHWSTVPGAVLYRVYQDQVPVLVTDIPTYIAPAPERPGTYLFTVTGIDGYGAEGPRSAPSPFVIHAAPPAPPVPTVRSEPGGRWVMVTWAAPKGATAFNLFKAEGQEGEFLFLASTMDEFFKDTQVVSGNTYRYAVSALGPSGRESERSKPGLVKVKEPAPLPREQRRRSGR